MKPEMDMAKVNENELKLLGTARYVITDFEKAISLLRDGLINLKPLITDVMDLKDYNQAYLKIQDEPETAMKIQINV